MFQRISIYFIELIAEKFSVKYVYVYILAEGEKLEIWQ